MMKEWDKKFPVSRFGNEWRERLYEATKEVGTSGKTYVDKAAFIEGIEDV